MKLGWRHARVALCGLAALPALYQLGLMVWTIGHRFSYPFDLEWMEGGLLTHALRYLHGQDIYVRPSIEFIPYLYTPLYPLLMAGLAEVVPLSYQLGRFISVVALAGIVWLIASEVVRSAGHRDRVAAWLAAAIAVGFVAATYPYVEGWYDLVRADTFFLALGLLGLALLRRWAPRPSGRLRGFWHPKVAVCALVLALSYIAKQTGVLLVAGGGLALVLLNWRALPIYGIVAGLVGGGITLLYNWISGGWYWLYTYGYYQQHGKDAERFFRSFDYILGRYPAVTFTIALAIIVVALRAFTRRRMSTACTSLLYWSWILLLGLLIGALSWAHQWAHFNGFMPAFVFASVCVGQAIVVLAETLADVAMRRSKALTAALSGCLILAVGLCAADLLRDRWVPARFVPREADVAAGYRLIDRIRRVKGPVFVPFHPWYAVLAGKPAHVHRMGLMDVTYVPPSRGKKRLPLNARRVAGLRKAISGQRFAAIILDDKARLSRYPGLRDYYRYAETLNRSEVPTVYTGARTVPRTIWLPKRSRKIGKGAPAPTSPGRRRASPDAL